LIRFIDYMLRIRRLEFRIAEIPIFAVPVLLESANSAAFRTFAFWEGVFLFFLLFAYGDVINCLSDRDLDAKEKPALSEAIYGLGVRAVTIQLWIMAVLAVALSVHLAWQLQRPILIALVAFGLLLGYAYSVPPLRLKSRGIWNFICLWAVIFFGPMIFAAFLVSPSPSLMVILVAAAYGLLQEGIVTVNSAEDFFEDTAAGVKTMVVALGLKLGITVALLAIAIGGIALVAILALALIYTSVTTFWWIAMTVLALVCGGAFAWVGFLRATIQNQDLGDAVAVVKRAGKFVPLWLTLVAWSALLVSLAMFLARPS